MAVLVILRYLKIWLNYFVQKDFKTADEVCDCDYLRVDNKNNIPCPYWLVFILYRGMEA